MINPISFQHLFTYFPLGNSHIFSDPKLDILTKCFLSVGLMCTITQTLSTHNLRTRVKILTIEIDRISDAHKELEKKKNERLNPQPVLGAIEYANPIGYVDRIQAIIKLTPSDVNPPLFRKNPSLVIKLIAETIFDVLTCSLYKNTQNFLLRHKIQLLELKKENILLKFEQRKAEIIQFFRIDRAQIDHSINVGELGQQSHFVEDERKKQILEVKQLRAKCQDLDEQLSKLLPWENDIKKLGHIPHKYQKKECDSTISGAIDLVKNSAMVQTETLKTYLETYESCRTAADVIRNGLSKVFDELIDKANEDKVLKINRSKGMLSHPFGMHSIYCYLVLDILSFCKLDYGCTGFAIWINENVCMLPSNPEYNLRINKIGARKIILNYQQCDDFTPDADTLKTEHGVNPVAAKWLLNQLAAEEMTILNTYLLKPWIENEHETFQQMSTFLGNSTNPRAELIELTAKHIHDIARAIGIKFGQTVLSDCWSNLLKDDQSICFIKEEDAPYSSPNVFATYQKPWIIDFELFNTPSLKYEFLPNITKTKECYRQLFSGNSSPLLEPVDSSTTLPPFLSMDLINKQFYVVHKVIGGISNTNEGCLFSNLLSIFMVDQTSDNVKNLRTVMGNYLNKLISDPDEDTQDYNEKVQLQKYFRDLIHDCHNCDTQTYANWLLGNISDEAASLDPSLLTFGDVAVAAYAFGVRIGVLKINMNAPFNIDSFGRIVPIDDIYGPNTGDILLMGFNTSTSSPDQVGTFYGLFPKLKSIFSNAGIIKDVVHYYLTNQMHHK